MLTHAQKIAAFVAVNGGRSLPGFQIVRLVQLRAESESIGEDLVKDGIVNPLWGAEGGQSSHRNLAKIANSLDYRL
jgi:hypothetical protein